jgi:tryptophan-rich sensory protein
MTSADRIPSPTAQILALVVWLAVVFAAAAVGAVASAQAASFYGGLVQPPWAPPPWLFGPVWTVLYTLMGIAAWLVWRDGGFRENRTALSLFILQLAANATWTWVFFVWHLGALAFVNILLLGGLIAITLALFWRVRPLASALLIPYLAWVGFAGALNWSLWRLNPAVLG